MTRDHSPQTVCSAPASPTTTAPAPSATGSGTATLKSPSYGKTFRLTTCSLNSDLANLDLRGSADGLALAVDATGGKGTLGVTGGTEQDGITLNGTVTRATVTPGRAFTATGTFGDPNFSGERFTLAGTCPE